MANLLDKLLGGSNQSDDFDAEVRRARLNFIAWLRRRRRELMQGEGGEVPAAAPSDLEGNDPAPADYGNEGGAVDDIWG
jgi:hypothetical protein